MRNLKLTLAYDGTAYAGWQVQPARTTVQETLEAAIERITGERLCVLASGRTDAGVHALGQVVGLRTKSHLPAAVLRRALNAKLPCDIVVLEAADLPEAFHPIRDVVRKCYRYYIYDGPIRDVFRRRYSWHYRRGRLDAEAMNRAAKTLLGKHDFRSFQTSGAERRTPVRTVFQISVERGRAGGAEFDLPLKRAGAGQGDYITVEVEADGFLYNMVRAIVGTLVEVGRGARPESYPAEVLDAADRSAAGPTAPPQGLFLMRVEYRCGVEYDR